MQVSLPQKSETKWLCTSYINTGETHLTQKRQTPCTNIKPHVKTTHLKETRTHPIYTPPQPPANVLTQATSRYLHLKMSPT